MFVSGGAPFVVLGIDPGLTRCGYAAIESTSAGNGRALSLGVVRTAPTDPLPQRLAVLRGELASLVAEFAPAVVVVEHVFFQVNVRTAMSVGQASGLALAEAAAAGCEVVQYTAEPGQADDRGMGRRRQAPGPADGAGPPGADRRAEAARRGRRRRARAVLSRHGAAQVTRGGRARREHERRNSVIGSLRGTVLERSGEGLVLLEVAGIGYLVNVMPRTLGELEPTTTAFLHIHHHIREDAQTLFGFLGRDERRTFDVLIATHGVGPALAMAILATHTPAALVDIVASADIGALTLVPGVGKKTAERLLVELKNRLSIPVLDAVGAHGTGPNGASAIADVRDALGGLGYAPEEVREVLRDVPAADAADACCATR